MYNITGDFINRIQSTIANGSKVIREFTFVSNRIILVCDFMMMMMQDLNTYTKNLNMSVNAFVPFSTYFLIFFREFTKA